MGEDQETKVRRLTGSGVAPWVNNRQVPVKSGSGSYRGGGSSAMHRKTWNIMRWADTGLSEAVAAVGAPPPPPSPPPSPGPSPPPSPGPVVRPERKVKGKKRQFTRKKKHKAKKPKGT